MKETELSEGVRRGDADVLGLVIERYLPQILRAARAAGLDHQQAEDVTQATFMTFVEKSTSFEGRSKVRTWLFGILFNKISEARRHLSRQQKKDDIDQVMESKFNDRGAWTKPPRAVDREVFSREVGELIEECLEEVPDKQRMAFILREVEDLTTEDICKILEVTPTHSGVLLFRARNRLRECLESKGVGRSD